MSLCVPHPQKVELDEVFWPEGLGLMSPVISYLLLPSKKAQAQNPPEGGDSLDRLLLGKFSILCTWQMAKSRLPDSVHPLLPSPCPSLSANFEDVQSPSDQGRKHSAGIVHTVSSHSSVIPFSICDESQSNKVDSKSECGEEEGVEKRQGTGNNPKLFTSFMSIVAKGPQWRTSVSPPSLHCSLVPSSLL